jgi:hypothetical protein
LYDDFANSPTPVQTKVNRAMHRRGFLSAASAGGVEKTQQNFFKMGRKVIWVQSKSVYHAAWGGVANG